MGVCSPIIEQVPSNDDESSLNSSLASISGEKIEKKKNGSMFKAKSIIETWHYVLVGGSARIPKVQEMLKEFFNGKEFCKSISPDEAVAYGAAVQAGVLTGKETRVLLIDVAPLSLGIETAGGVMTKLIERILPFLVRGLKSSLLMLTAKLLSLFKFMKDERTITTCWVNSRGVPKIEVTFEIDANGIMKVATKDESSGKTENTTITNDKGRLSKEEVDEMLRQAENMKAQDDELRKKVEAKNHLESYAYQMKSTAEDPNLAGKIPESDKKTIKEGCEAAIGWIDNNQTAS